MLTLNLGKVASLSEELDDLRRSICRNCKTKFVPSYAPISARSPSCSGGPLPSPGAQPAFGFPSILTAYAGEPLKSPIPTHPTASSSTQQTTPRVEEIHSKQPKWIVSYNSRIKQALHIDLSKTFAFTSMVFCVKFSPDGKYLAVGLCSGNGKTYIYDVEKGLKIWFAAYIYRQRPQLTFRTSSLVDLYLKNQPMVWCVQFSPNSKYIAIASGKQIRVCSSYSRVPTSIDLSTFFFRF